MRSYGADDTGMADDGMQTDNVRGKLAVALVDKITTASFAFPSRVNFSPEGVILFDLAAVNSGNITLKALCWDSQGRFVEEVDVFPHVSAAGLYEYAVTDHRDAFPPATSQLSFKIWLEGEKTSATLGDLCYGIMQ